MTGFPDDGRIRVVVEHVTPTVDGGRFAIKRLAGEPVHVEADVFVDGHDIVRALLAWRAVGAERWADVPMERGWGNRFAAEIVVREPGAYEYVVEGFVDAFATWQDGFAKRAEAGDDLTPEFEVGARLVDAAAARVRARTGTVHGGAKAEKAGHERDARRLDDLARALRGADEWALDAALGPDLTALMRSVPDRSRTVRSQTLPLIVDRDRAGFAAWYERFPRSTVHRSEAARAKAARANRHGTLRDLIDDLPRIAEMGFDTLYLPPIHPIGLAHRKGPDNTGDAGPDDPGSPWAIGAAAGGHTAIHPQLGSLADFDALVAAATECELEIALDLAFQCSPDHPWVREHPTWFAHRPDGSIRHAENPPKQYQDIYPLDFETDDWRELWQALKDVVDTWIERGVRCFRVDNPHTKAFGFWEWLLAQVRAEHPETIFLAEAFTDPERMYRLARLGFTQSYTYFTWRPDRAGLEAYVRELTSPPVADVFRPNFWPNTPDILTEQLQHGTAATFAARLILAATLSSVYGIYGPVFELMQHTAVRAHSEEYAASEKYEVRHWNLDAPGSLEPLIARVNAIRRAHPALQQTRGIRLLSSDNPQIMAYLKQAGHDTILVVVNLDPDWTQSAWIDVPIVDIPVISGNDYVVRDLLADVEYQWSGERNFVELDPSTGVPAHILHVARS